MAAGWIRLMASSSPRFADARPYAMRWAERYARRLTAVLAVLRRSRMNKLLLLAALLLGSSVSAAPAGLPAECLDDLRAHADKMRKELALSDAQAAALRNEFERYHGQLLTARADHRSAVAKILTPEQQAKVDAKHAERRKKMLERCAGD
jgi:Spy/CpxP family protein refolding chaperone